MAALAGELGFYDQSHFIREFRAVVGWLPARISGVDGADHEHGACSLPPAKSSILGFVLHQTGIR